MPNKQAWWCPTQVEVGGGVRWPGSRPTPTGTPGSVNSGPLLPPPSPPRRHFGLHLLLRLFPPFSRHPNLSCPDAEAGGAKTGGAQGAWIWGKARSQGPGPGRLPRHPCRSEFRAPPSPSPSPPRRAWSPSRETTQRKKAVGRAQLSRAGGGRGAAVLLRHDAGGGRRAGGGGAGAGGGARGARRAATCGEGHGSRPVDTKRLDA